MERRLAPLPPPPPGQVAAPKPRGEMSDFLPWLNGLDAAPGSPRDLRWAWVTLTLSAFVAIGYGVIAFNWYFQSKLQRPVESRAALARLRWIVLCCCVCGYVFYATDMAWSLWRLYDV